MPCKKKSFTACYFPRPSMNLVAQLFTIRPKVRHGGYLMVQSNCHDVPGHFARSNFAEMRRLQHVEINTYGTA
ncbi:hypothetical protein BH20BAC1_BH20BAC1_03970 [soil metagenome]